MEEITSLYSLAGKVALVTGASSGIGAATAHRFANAGAKVALLSRDKSELQEQIDSIHDKNPEAQTLFAKADVTRPEEMESAIAKVISEWSRLDILVVNAGTNGVWAPLDEITWDEWNTTVAVNLHGTFLSLKYSIPYLRESSGNICIVSSINGSRVFNNEGAIAYAATKAAQVSIAKMLALELSDSGVRVNVVCPGGITTAIHDKTERRDLESIDLAVEYTEGTVPLTQGKMGEADDVANLIHFLSSSAAKHISGTEVWIDGAESLLR